MPSYEHVTAETPMGKIPEDLKAIANCEWEFDQPTMHGTIYIKTMSPDYSVMRKLDFLQKET